MAGGAVHRIRDLPECQNRPCVPDELTVARHPDTPAAPDGGSPSPVLTRHRRKTICVQQRGTT